MKSSVAARMIGSIAVFVCGGLLVGCSGLGSDAAKLKQIILSPANPQLAKGTSMQFAASGMYDDGNQRALSGTPTWQTSQPAIAAVDAEGNVKAMSEGVAQISATYGGITGNTSITVGPPSLVSITISPNQFSLPLGESAQLSASGAYSDGTVQDLTQSATWSSSGPAIATVSAAGVVVATGVGPATINATSGNATGSAALAVNPPAVIALNILPASSTISLGTSRQLRAIATFSNTTTQDVTAVATWGSNQSTIAGVGSPGNVSGIAQGVALVSASFQSVTASAAVDVGPPALVSITVSPNPSSLPLGESEQLSASGKYSDGSVQNLTQSVTWVSSGSNVTVSATGSVVAKVLGAATIGATSSSITGSANLTVTSPVVTGVNVVPAVLSVSLDTSHPLQAIASFSDGTTQNVTATATWSSTQSAIATVTRGSVAGVGRGNTQVSATYQGQTGSSAVTVGPPALVAISVSPSQSSLPVGESEQLTATGKYSDGSLQNLTQSVTWSCGAAIASVSLAGNVLANSVGTTSITASNGSTLGSASLTVAPAVITALSIVPSTLSIILSGSFQLQAIATLSNGTTQDMTATATWSVIQPNIANITSGGMLTAMQVGSATIQAQTNSATGTASLTVVPLMLVNYYSYINATKSGTDGTLQLINTGLTSGNLCAMVYVFDQQEELNECCGCTISTDGMRTLSLLNDLTANTLTGKKPRAGEIKVVPSDPTQNPQCNAGFLTPSGELSGWETNPQVSAGTIQITETPSKVVAMEPNEASYLQNLCGYLQKLGSGSGTCSCGTGD
jgi:trimeric autotransporter adhesin